MNNAEFAILKEILPLFNCLNISTNTIEKDTKENIILNEDVFSKEEIVTYFKMKNSIEEDKKIKNIKCILSNFDVKESDISKYKILYLLDS